MENEKSIFDYMDYRSFVSDFIAAKKELNSSYSMRALASRIQCNPGFFNRILRGERNLMPSHLLELGKVMKLSRKEQQYFELLVSYNHAKKQNERDHFFELLQQFKKTAIKQLDIDQYGLYSHWYFLVLRELLSIVPCKIGSDLSYRKIGKMLNPAISPSEVKDALELLLRLGVINEDQDGNLKPTDNFTASGTDLPQVIVNRFLLEFADLARRAIDAFPRNQRRFSTLTFSISQDGYTKIAERIDEFRRDLLKIVENDQQVLDRVYHLNFHLFPVTALCKDNKNEKQV